MIFVQAINQVASDASGPVNPSLPTLSAIVLGAIVVVGILLWLGGGRLARVACVVCGLAVGAAGGYVVGRQLQNQGAYMLPLVIGGGIAGALVAGLLFRIWVAVIGAAILAAIVPAAVLVWQGAVTITPPGAPHALADQKGQEIRKPEGQGAMRDRASQGLWGQGKKQDTEEAADSASDPLGGLVPSSEQLRDFYDRVVERFKAQWQALDSSSRTVVYTGGLIGAVVGFALGLFVPNLAGVIQTALVGSIMMLLAGGALVGTYVPDQARWLPQTPRSLLLVLGLITLIGVGVQWMIFFRKSDK